jgi:peptidoglycan/xylan/chitin deacetylase (PgdA/CDA1 family)
MFSRRSIAAGLGAAWIGGGAGLAPTLGAAKATDAGRPPFPSNPWPNGARAAVSLSYDDSLDSQLDHAVAQLEAARVKATFFLTKDNADERINDWVQVARLGHEVGNHTVTHQCDLRLYTPESFERKELRPMEDYLDTHFGQARSHLYAYPCSVTNLGPGGPNEQLARYSALLRKAGLRAARACDGPPNSLGHARLRPYDLRASTPTYDQDDPRLAMSYVRETIRQGAWAVLIFHDILPARTGPGETSMAHHEEILQWLASQPIWNAPMGEVLAYLGNQSGEGSDMRRSR